MALARVTVAALAIMLAVGSGPSQAQVAPPPAGTSAPARGAFIAKFQAANVTHDGRLTLAQAQQGHMPQVVRNFGAIDHDGKGYVTLADIRAYRQAVRAAKAAPSPK